MKRTISEKYIEHMSNSISKGYNISKEERNQLITEAREFVGLLIHKKDVDLKRLYYVYNTLLDKNNSEKNHCYTCRRRMIKEFEEYFVKIELEKEENSKRIESEIKIDSEIKNLKNK